MEDTIVKLALEYGEGLIREILSNTNFRQTPFGLEHFVVEDNSAGTVYGRFRQASREFFIRWYQYQQDVLDLEILMVDINEKVCTTKREFLEKRKLELQHEQKEHDLNFLREELKATAQMAVQARRQLEGIDLHAAEVEFWVNSCARQMVLSLETSQLSQSLISGIRSLPEGVRQAIDLKVSQIFNERRASMVDLHSRPSPDLRLKEGS